MLLEVDQSSIFKIALRKRAKQNMRTSIINAGFVYPFLMSLRRLLALKKKG
jgi:hypothetical protein